MIKKYLIKNIALIAIAFIPVQVFAWAEWSEASLEYIYGDQYHQESNQFSGACFAAPDANDDACETDLTTFTFDYANGWKYGETFLYFDTFFDGEQVNIYSQGWENFHLDKMVSINPEDYTNGIIKHIGPSLGWQYFSFNDFLGGDQMDLFFGVNMIFGVPEVLDIIQYWGMTTGIYHDINTATDFDNQWYTTFYGRANWYWGPTRWQYDGYIDIYGDRTSNTGAADYTSNIFSQHQIKLDVGLLAFDRPNTLYVGTEIQWTENTFGITGSPRSRFETDEFFPSFLIEWVF